MRHQSHYAHGTLLDDVVDVFTSGMVDVYKFGDPVTVFHGTTGVVQTGQDPHCLVDTLAPIPEPALAGADLHKMTLLHAALRQGFTEEIDREPEPAHVPDPHRG